MTMPDYQTLMLPVLKLSAEGVIRASDAVDRLADEFDLTDEERSEPMPSGRSGQMLFNNRVHWAITYLAHAHVIDRPIRAHFSITERGIELLSRNLSKITNEILMEFSEFRDWIRPSRSTNPKSIEENSSTQTQTTQTLLSS